MLDPRLTPARPDLAAERLRGQVEAERFVAPRAASVAAPSVALRRRPEAGASWETEALHGEAVALYEEREGWAYVQLERDGYVGYLESEALRPPVTATHRVSALRTHAYSGPSIKLPHRLALSLGAQVAAVGETGDFLVDATGLHYWARHFAPAQSREPDYVAVAEMFLHAPYLWGGRTSEGIDCSGLAQAALRAAGADAPRDSDMLESWAPAAPEGSPLRQGLPLLRGDLVFWKGHVGVMRDAETLLHANGFHMAVVSEPLARAVERILQAGGGPLTSVRRPLA